MADSPDPIAPPCVSRPEKDAGSQMLAPVPPREPTLRELLMSAWGNENAREWNRQAVAREAARSPLSALHLSVSAAALNAIDPWDEVPAACVIRAFTNNEFGLDLTRESVLRVRGRVCELLDIDTTAADALPLSRVAEVLRNGTKPPGPVGDQLAELRWLKVTQVASLFAMNAGQVSRHADKGTFVTNGNTGSDRRIDVLSVIRWELDRLAKQDAVDDALADRHGG